MKILTHIPYNRWDKYRKRKIHAQFQLDLHSFDQNILSYFSFTFYIQFILFAGK